MDIPDVLKEMVEAKRRELERQKAAVPLASLEEGIQRQRPALNLAGALMGDKVRVIAEVKKASPARGLLRADFDPRELAAAYVQNGAAAISVLTNASHFQGSIGDLVEVGSVARAASVPVLRKDFLFDPYQVYESRAHGADAILLIVAVLEPRRLQELMELSHRFWMQCLVEVHSERELQVALDAGAEVVGINNRDLRTLRTDLAVTERLAPRVPPGKVIVSESGIGSQEDVLRVRRAGAAAILVGEALVTASDVGAKLRELA